MTTRLCRRTTRAHYRAESADQVRVSVVGRGAYVFDLVTCRHDAGRGCVELVLFRQYESSDGHVEVFGDSDAPAPRWFVDFWAALDNAYGASTSG